MKFFIILSIIFLCSCSKENEPQNVNELLMSIKNYDCSMNITFHSNKNLVTCIANQTYTYPEKYSINFLDNTNFSISYSNKMLTICNNFLNLTENKNNYENINTNPLFLSYFLNSYFNSKPENIITSNFDEISIILPNNNSYLESASLKLKDNIPSSLVYYDKNKNPKINIIYTKFIFESS